MGWVELQAWSPLAVALITVAGGLVAYSFQKYADRRNQLIDMRRSAYRAYLRALINQIDFATGETQNALHLAELDLFVVASDRVLRRVAEFQRYMAFTSHGRGEREPDIYKAMLADCLLDMRADCFEKSRLNQAEALMLLPFD